MTQLVCKESRQTDWGLTLFVGYHTNNEMQNEGHSGQEDHIGEGCDGFNSLQVDSGQAGVANGQQVVPVDANGECKRRQSSESDQDGGKAVSDQVEIPEGQKNVDNPVDGQ